MGVYKMDRIGSEPVDDQALLDYYLECTANRQPVSLSEIEEESREYDKDGLLSCCQVLDIPFDESETREELLLKVEEGLKRKQSNAGHNLDRLAALVYIYNLLPSVDHRI